MNWKSVQKAALLAIFLAASGAWANDEQSVGQMEKDPAVTATETADAAPGAFELARSFKKYHESKDIDGLMSLMCMDNVPPEVKANTRKALLMNMNHKISKIHVQKNFDAATAAGYTMNAVDYRFNMTPVGSLEIWFETEGGGVLNLSLLVGVKGDKYLIATAVPVPASPGH
jgi:hypothetical protein